MLAPFMSDAFFGGLSSSTREVNAAETLPPLCYSDPLFYEFEKEAIFFREWLCVGREAWARKPGDYFTAFQVGEPIVVARTRDGALKAMSAVCRHRGIERSSRPRVERDARAGLARSTPNRRCW